MAEDKFIPSYFEVNYHIHKGTVYRNEDSSGECQIAKEKCLRDCFSKLFNNADDVDTYKKELCKSCGEFVAKTCTSRPNLCNQKCARIYAKKEARFRQIDNKKVYLKCVECDAPKKNENQQKYKLCYNCDQEKKLDAMLRTPDGEIHGYASSGDEDTHLFMGSLSIS